jgi:glycerophosphoryl diester phosphodiesterase
VFWQAHRGGGADEAPDNTMAGFRYAWGLGGIPEADVRTTRDGVLICLHDSTLARTTVAPAEIRDITVDALELAEVRRWDAGIRFAGCFRGELVPTLREVFETMASCSECQLYIDLKDVDLARLDEMVAEYALADQIIVASPHQCECETVRKLITGIRTMCWIGGSSQEIMKRFDAIANSGFAGLDQVQLHLNRRPKPSDWYFQISQKFLKNALIRAQSRKVDLEVLPWEFNDAALSALLDLGIRWFATDQPKLFAASVSRWRKAA